MVLAEAAPFGVALCDAKGRVLDVNGSLDRIFAADSERDLIRREIARAAQSVTALSMVSGSAIETAPRASSELRTLSSHYKLSAVALDEHWAGHQSSVAVLIEPIGPRRVDSRTLRARYGLTPREIQIAVLLQRGLSSRQISKAMGISVNTARRHAEHVLAKLNVHSRSAVGSKIFD
jgi:DNA-binding NarL/FixJ family response regulator